PAPARRLLRRRALPAPRRHRAAGAAPRRCLRDQPADALRRRPLLRAARRDDGDLLRPQRELAGTAALEAPAPRGPVPPLAALRPERDLCRAESPGLSPARAHRLGRARAADRGVAREPRRRAGARPRARGLTSA